MRPLKVYTWKICKKKIMLIKWNIERSRHKPQDYIILK